MFNKKLTLPNVRQRHDPLGSGLNGSQGLANTFTGQLDWLLIAPPITDYTSWYDAYDVKTMDAGLVSGGSNIGTWLNKKWAKGAGLAQDVDGVRPDFLARRIGKHYALNFDDGDCMFSGAAEMKTRPMSVMMVYNADSVGSHNRFLISGPNPNGIGMYIDSSNAKLSGIVVSVVAFNSTLVTTTGTHVAGISVNTATSWDFIYDGSFDTQSNATATSAGAQKLAHLTGSSGAGTNGFDGAIGEVFIWDRALSQAEMTKMYKYFQVKWGL